MGGPIEWLPLRSVAVASRETQALCRELAPLVDGRASASSRDRISYARDLWPRALLRARAGETPSPPDVIVWPDSVEQVVAVTRRARELGVAVTPFGGGTGLCGAAVTLEGGVVLDLRRMNRIRELDPEALEAEVESGIVGEVLERALNRRGLSTGHLPASMRASTLGGWIATRGAGQSSGRHGKIEDLVASLEVVDGRGEAHVTPRRPMPGWDETRAFIGSEGTLGTVCAARLHLVPVPEARVFSSYSFRGLKPGMQALQAMLRAGVRPAVARLYDPLDAVVSAERREGQERGRAGPMRRAFDEAVTLRLERLAARAAGARIPGLNRFAGRLRESLLILVLEGPADLCELEAEAAGRICAGAGGEDRGPDPARGWLENRHAGWFAQSRLYDSGAFGDMLEVAVTWERAEEVYWAVRQALEPLAVVMGHLSHAYLEGCCLVFSFAGAAGGLEQMERRHHEIWRAGVAAASGAGATISHHHGIGLQKLGPFKSQLGDGLRLVRALKANFDPDGIMNPGKLGT